jgi:hypothetical protein
VLRRVLRSPDGSFAVRLSAVERELVRALPEQLRTLLLETGDAEDPALRRLFPPASRDDDEVNAEFERLVRDDLLAERLETLDTLERTADAEVLTEDELVAWLAALNDVRLVLGVRLDLTEETTERDFARDDPRAQTYGVYLFLSFLEEQVVEALSGD